MVLENAIGHSIDTGSFGHLESVAGPSPLPDSHRPSHLGMIGKVPRYPSRAGRVALSAVVVPTRRTSGEAASGLAVGVAESHDAQLIVLRSGPASAEPFLWDRIPVTSRPAVLIDIPDRSEALLPRWRNGNHRIATLHRATDVGVKRNIGLLIGQMCGWETVLMLDDDITTRRASQLPSVRTDGARSETLLRLDDVLADFAEYPQLRAAGYLQKDFDDNSVVCHARRLAGWAQDGFVSGGAVVVRCGGYPPFFPAAYNEDWLFFLYAMLEGRHTRPSSTVRWVGAVHQTAYYPYSAVRARAEELGDVLAEGLFALLDNPPAEVFAVARSKKYWQKVIWSRQDMIVALIGELRAQHGRHELGLIADVDEALRAALGVYEGPAHTWAADLAEYCDRLVLDLHEWHDVLDGITPQSAADVLDLDEALDLLGLSDRTTWLGPRRTRTA
jgi:hypothetical protein